MGQELIENDSAWNVYAKPLDDKSAYAIQNIYGKKISARPRFVTVNGNVFVKKNTAGSNILINTATPNKK